jgi:hypothetical protein
MEPSQQTDKWRRRNRISMAAGAMLAITGAALLFIYPHAVGIWFGAAAGCIGFLGALLRERAVHASDATTKSG